ncbi:MAG: HEPN domain-containing protein [Thermodesulfobacteriota bacterium]
MTDLIRESLRWSAQAEDDYRFVCWVKKQGGFHDKTCFMAQQAGEKMLKACLYATGQRKIWGHSLAEMVLTRGEQHPLFRQIGQAAKRLDRYYIWILSSGARLWRTGPPLSVIIQKNSVR